MRIGDAMCAVRSTFGQIGASWPFQVMRVDDSAIAYVHCDIEYVVHAVKKPAVN
jgi:hypothetical protein